MLEQDMKEFPWKMAGDERSQPLSSCSDPDTGQLELKRWIVPYQPAIRPRRHSSKWGIFSAEGAIQVSTPSSAIERTQSVRSTPVQQAGTLRCLCHS